MTRLPNHPLPPKLVEAVALDALKLALFGQYSQYANSEFRPIPKPVIRPVRHMGRARLVTGYRGRRRRLYGLRRARCQAERQQPGTEQGL